MLDNMKNESDLFVHPGILDSDVNAFIFRKRQVRIYEACHWEKKIISVLGLYIRCILNG